MSFLAAKNPAASIFNATKPVASTQQPDVPFPQLMPHSVTSETLKLRAHRKEDMTDFVARQLVTDPRGPLVYVASLAARDIIREEMRRAKIQNWKSQAMAIERNIRATWSFRLWYAFVQERKSRRKSKRYKERVKEANAARAAKASETGIGNFRSSLNNEVGTLKGTSLEKPTSRASLMGPPSVAGTRRRHERTSVRANKRARMSTSAASSLGEALDPAIYGDDDIPAMLKLIRGPIPGGGRTSTMKTDYFRNKAAGLNKIPDFRSDYKNKPNSGLFSTPQSRRSSFNSSFSANAFSPSPEFLKRKRINDSMSPPASNKRSRLFANAIRSCEPAVIHL